MKKEKSLFIEQYIIIIFFSMIILALSADVIARYIFSYGISWSGKLAVILFVWITFAGISLGAAKKMHLKVSVITFLLPEKWHQKVFLIGDIVATLFGFFIAYKMFFYTMTVMENGQTFPILWDLPAWLMYLPGFLGMAGFSIRIIQFSIIPYFLDQLEDDSSDDITNML